MAEEPARRKIAIITGASSGIGWATALRLAEHGYDLCVTARRRAPLEELAQHVEALGAACLVITGDVTSSEDVERVVQGCLEKFGRIDVLVNDAAVQVYSYFEDYSWDEIRRINDVNFFGYLRFARAVLPQFRRQGHGLIVNVLSIMSQGGLQFFTMYDATKHALLGWAKCLKLELEGSGIDITNVLMPALNTPLYDHCVTKLGFAPKPLPPIYDTKLAAKAILHAIKKPKFKHIPVFLQGRLILWTDYVVPVVGFQILRLIGVRGQLRSKRVSSDRGNLWAPTEIGVGPHGTLRATPAWKRYAPAVLALAAGAGLYRRWSHS